MTGTIHWMSECNNSVLYHACITIIAKLARCPRLAVPHPQAAIPGARGECVAVTAELQQQDVVLVAQ